MTTITDVRTVAIPVTDQDRAIAFYVDTLGFEKRLDALIGPDMRWIEVAPPGADISIALTTSTATSPAGVDTGIRFTATDVKGEHDTLSRNGVSVDDVLDWPGVPPMFTLRDPDGNVLYIVETTEGAET